MNGTPRCLVCSSGAGLASPTVLPVALSPFWQRTLPQQIGCCSTSGSAGLGSGAPRSISKGWCKEGSTGAACSHHKHLPGGCFTLPAPHRGCTVLNPAPRPDQKMPDHPLAPLQCRASPPGSAWSHQLSPSPAPVPQAHDSEGFLGIYRPLSLLHFTKATQGHAWLPFPACPHHLFAPCSDCTPVGSRFARGAPGGRAEPSVVLQQQAVRTSTKHHRERQSQR